MATNPFMQRMLVAFPLYLIMAGVLSPATGLLLKV